MSIGRVPGVTGIQPSIVDAKGDLIVATAADSVDRLAVGSANQVLTVDSSTATGLKWATPAAGGDLVKINSTTIGTAVSSVSLDNVFSSTYNVYLIVVKWDGSSATPNVRFRMRTGGTDNTGATSYQARGLTSTGSLTQYTLASSSFELGSISNNGKDTTYIEIVNPFEAERTGFFQKHFYNSNNELTLYGAAHMVSTSYDGFTLFPSTGTLTGGTITVWGYKK